MSEPKPDSPTLFSNALLDMIRSAVREAIFESGISNGNGAEKWFYSSKEAAQLIGIPKSWLETAAKRGEIKRIQFGHYKVFSREDLARFAEEYRKKSGA
ncbi:MAG: helix-turn-helix domain-containing protein [Deltaproteobacteria bacterium]|nr:helix-turn-helix domain-containing protein [Deltaproteobacteria bacterium]